MAGLSHRALCFFSQRRTHLMMISGCCKHHDFSFPPFADPFMR